MPDPIGDTLPKYRAWLFWGYLLSVITGLQLAMYAANYGNQVKVAKAFYGLCSAPLANYPCHDITEKDYVNSFLNLTTDVGFGPPYWQTVWIGSVFFAISLIVLAKGLIRKAGYKREALKRNSQVSVN